MSRKHSVRTDVPSTTSIRLSDLSVVGSLLKRARAAITVRNKSSIPFHKRVPRWRRYIAGAALLILASNIATALHPEWFVAPTGRIPLFGGPLVVLLFAVGMWYRVRAAYLLTIAGAAIWAWVAVERYRHRAWGIPEAYLFLAVAMLMALALLVAPRSVRNEFFFRAETD